MILESIIKYMSLYIPKYTAAFLDKHSDTNNGEFYIGIADDGTIQGIPYQGNINKQIIYDEFYKVISASINSNNEITESIKIEIIPIQYKATNIESYIPIYDEYLENIKLIELKQIEYQKKLNEWALEHNKYAQKLIDIFNSEPTRSELKEYIKMHDSNSDVLNLFNDNKFVLETKTHEEINELKNNINDPYYWVCKFKDQRLDEVRLYRPINKIKNEILSYLNPMCILMKISNMIPWWMQNNDNMKLYIIKISYTKKLYDNVIYYFDKNNKESRCYRTLTENKPCCAKISS
jgi:hypothetical protein